MNETAESLIAYSRENSRVCSVPGRWHKLWELLPDRLQVGAGWQPSLPLILAAWDHASNLEKMIRLAEHIEWADKHGNLTEVAEFLRKLDESQWHHLGD